MGSTDKDDPVERLVEMAIEAQTRMMIAYTNNLREEMRKIVRREFGGEQVHFRKCEDDRNKDRDARIRQEALPIAQGGLGLSIRALARRHHLSKTQVERILKTAPAA